MDGQGEAGGAVGRSPWPWGLDLWRDDQEAEKGTERHE